MCLWVCSVTLPWRNVYSTIRQITKTCTFSSKHTSRSTNRKTVTRWQDAKIHPKKRVHKEEIRLILQSEKGRGGRRNGEYPPGDDKSRDNAGPGAACSESSATEETAGGGAHSHLGQQNEYERWQPVGRGRVRVIEAVRPLVVLIGHHHALDRHHRHNQKPNEKKRGKAAKRRTVLRRISAPTARTNARA